MMMALLLVGCTSHEYSAGPLGLHWKLPAGVHLESEQTEGPLTSARFSNGVEVRSVAAAPLPVSTDLEVLRQALLAATGLAPRGDVRVGRVGSIANGPVAYWELASSADRTMLYYVPGQERYVVISLVASAGTFDRKSNQLVLSLSTLKLQ
jgi:hypothetical protein